MEYITMIMSGLALLAATVSLIITLCEKKRSQKRNADMANLVKAECNVLRGEYRFAIEESFKSVNDSYLQKFSEFRMKMEKNSTKIDNLEKGIIPDYQEALAAKNSVDEFNRGLSAIMGYDPMEVARKAREERHYGGEVD